MNSPASSTHASKITLNNVATATFCVYALLVITTLVMSILQMMNVISPSVADPFKIAASVASGVFLVCSLIKMCIDCRKTRTTLDRGVEDDEEIDDDPVTQAAIAQSLAPSNHSSHSRQPFPGTAYHI